jgi:hypothetical protein
VTIQAASAMSLDGHCDSSAERGGQCLPRRPTALFSVFLDLA